MSKISLEPNESGAGTFSIVSPDSNTNRTLNLPDESGILFSDGSGVPGSAVTGQLASSNMPAGSVIQMVHETQGTETTFTNPERGDYDVGSSASITPAKSDSQIIIFAYFQVYFLRGDDTLFYGNPFIKRNGTEIFRDPDARYITDHDAENSFNPYINIIDSPNTTNELTYSLHWEHVQPRNNGDLVINRNNAKAFITLMEVAQ